jgi:hypothetical protein
MPMRAPLAVLLAAVLISLTGAVGTYARTVETPDGQLSGRVEVCGRPGATGVRKCSLAGATVTVRIVHGEAPGRVVATRDAPHGRFSFTLPAGKYLPSASRVDTKRNVDGCVSVQTTVRKGHTTRDTVRCYVAYGPE